MKKDLSDNYSGMMCASSFQMGGCEKTIHQKSLIDNLLDSATSSVKGVEDSLFNLST